MLVRSSEYCSRYWLTRLRSCCSSCSLHSAIVFVLSHTSPSGSRSGRGALGDVRRLVSQLFAPEDRTCLLVAASVAARIAGAVLW